MQALHLTYICISEHSEILFSPSKREKGLGIRIDRGRDAHVPNGWH